MTTYAVDKETRAKLNWLNLATKQDKDTRDDYPLRGIHVSSEGSEATDGYRLHIVRDLFLYVERDAETSAIDNGIHIVNSGKPIKGTIMETTKLDDRYPETQRVLPTTEPSFSFLINAQYLIDAAGMPGKEEGITIEYYAQKDGEVPRIMIKNGECAALIMPMIKSRR